jgi:hypothetical protein
VDQENLQQVMSRIEPKDPTGVCELLPNGEWRCPKLEEDKPSWENSRSEVERMLAGPRSALGNTYDLICDIITVIRRNERNMDEPDRRRRFSAIVGSVDRLTQKPGDLPSLLTYEFNSLAGDVVGNHFRSKGELVRMHRVLDHFKKVPDPRP